MNAQPPAGWYPDPSGVGQRYWNGEQWTAHSDSVPPPPASHPGAPPAQVVYVERPTNTLATVALVCGIAGTVLGLIPLLYIIALALGLVAFVTGIIARRRSVIDGRRAMSTWGIALGVVAVALGIAGGVTVNNAVNDLDRSLNSTTTTTTY